MNGFVAPIIVYMNGRHHRGTGSLKSRIPPQRNLLLQALVVVIDKRLASSPPLVCSGAQVQLPPSQLPLPPPRLGQGVLPLILLICRQQAFCLLSTIFTLKSAHFCGGKTPYQYSTRSKDVVVTGTVQGPQVQHESQHGHAEDLDQDCEKVQHA
jgi:hypothetical protein